MRRKARVDANQPEIVKALRKMGASVRHTHTIGDGFPDVVIGYRGFNFLVEIKDGNKPPSGRILTPDEQEFFDTWKGSAFIVESIDDCLEIISG